MDLNKVKNLYDNNISEFGIDPKSVGWGTQEKINIRFKQLFYMIEDKSVPFSLNFFDAVKRNASITVFPVTKIFSF